mgnify:CR=1 FL=1
MIPIPLLITVIKKYAGNALMVVLAAAIVFGMYLHWKGQIYDQGVHDERAKWIKRDADTQRQSAELLKLKQHENQVKSDLQNQRSMGAIETYANYSTELYRQLANAKRMPNNTTASSGSVGTMPRASQDTCPPAGTGEEDVQRKLSIKAAELLIEQYLVPNAEVIE